MSLKAWIEVGMFDREIEIYKRLCKELKKIYFVTYGGKQDRLYQKKLSEIDLLSSIWYRNRTRTIMSLVMKYFPQIYKSDIFKTNQIYGSEIPVWLKTKFKKKLIVRCGFLYSYFTQQQTDNEKKVNEAILLEKKAFSSADMGIVTTSWQRDIVVEKYTIDSKKIAVIPNYVLTSIFKPQHAIRKQYDLIFVGRGDKQKNISNLLKAIHYLKKNGMKISLLMVGGCCFDSKIRELVKSYHLDVHFKGTIQNFRMPDVLNQARVFILPSYYEGHPKTLLEAMSCELPCIGSDVTGIREDIEHLKTGFLCNTDYKSIANALETILPEESLQKRIGKNARKYIRRKYDIDRILPMEFDVIQEVISK